MIARSQVAQLARAPEGADRMRSVMCDGRVFQRTALPIVKAMQRRARHQSRCAIGHEIDRLLRGHTDSALSGVVARRWAEGVMIHPSDRVAVLGARPPYARGKDTRAAGSDRLFAMRDSNPCNRCDPGGTLTRWNRKVYRLKRWRGPPS